MDNNIAEAFNGWILDAKFKSIVSMLEEIRVRVMERMHEKREVEKKGGKTNISLNALTKLEKNMAESTNCRDSLEL